MTNKGPQVGITSPIVDDDPLLAAPWKGEISQAKVVTRQSRFPFGSGGLGGDSGNPEDPTPTGDRPSLTDFELIGFESYRTRAGIQKVKVKIKAYNSSGTDIKKFEIIRTSAQKEGGT